MAPAALRTYQVGARAEAALALAVLVGVALATVHWVGLVLGGALVGLVAPTLRRALVTGLYLGGAVLFAFLLYLWLVGALAEALAMGRILYLDVAIALLVPTLAAGAVGGFTEA